MDLGLTRIGNVDVETGSSAIRLRGVHGSLTAVTESGRVSVEGAPSGTWKVSTGSGSVDMSSVVRSVTVDATSGSGSVNVNGATVQGSVSKRKVAGTVGGGKPSVVVSSRSGSIRITVR